MIKAAQAAEMLGMSTRFVYGLGESGILTKYKIGKGVRFDENEVRAYLESCKCQSITTRPRAVTASTLTVRLPGERGSALADYFRKAGMPWATFHTLRHSTASEMINAGVALNTVGEVLGHKSQASTRRYAHMLNSTKADALRLVGRKVA